MDLGLRGKVALVTGSWRGTGAGIAEMLGREGCRVLVHGFEKGQPDEVMARLGEAGLDVQAVHGDIATDAGADQLVEEALEAAGHVDVLINNYGVAEGGDWTATPTSEWVGLYQKNVLSGVRLVHALSPPMVERGWGRIVFVGTIGSLRPAARMPHYYASKAVLPNLCVSLAKELGGSGVTVNLVSPGIIATQEIKATLARRAWAQVLWELGFGPRPAPRGHVVTLGSAYYYRLAASNSTYYGYYYYNSNGGDYQHQSTLSWVCLPLYLLGVVCVGGL